VAIAPTITTRMVRLRNMLVPIFRASPETCGARRGLFGIQAAICVTHRSAAQMPGGCPNRVTCSLVSELGLQADMDRGHSRRSTCSPDDGRHSALAAA
jgi:hypothetical protein